MFGLFKKDPIKKLEDEYQTLMTKAMNVQRNGDIKQYSLIMKEADVILKQINQIESDKN